MGSFEKKYAGLNKAQTQAVDCLEGPLMVIAGPGTGKTELLSVRVANILQKTDALAENILCLTFTDSGAVAMKERLSELMGKDAYKVAVHTSHGFGSEIINKHGDYFYSGAAFRPADELGTHQILSAIFADLPHTNPLASQMNGQFVQLKNVQHTISDFKKSGLTPDEIQRLLRHNQGFLEYAEPIVATFFASPMHKSMLEHLDMLYNKLADYQSQPTGVPNIEALSTVFLSQLKSAIDTAQAQQKVTAMTAWRNQWLEKNKKNHFVFKDTLRTKKLLAASLIYSDYLNAMQTASLYDYDDMILRLVHALEVFPDLKFNLQEQYQYILVDEFQDTNGAQMRILLSLADNPVMEGKPNIMVVGDDDQAIYSFQGAELSNLLSFQKRFKPELVSLRENYRSAPVILEKSRQVITLSQERLENVLVSIDKTPIPKQAGSKSQTQLIEAADTPSEYDQVASAVHQRIKDGQKPSSIAVLARNHADIQKMLPFFKRHNVAFSYEHQDDILQSPPIQALIDIARVVVWLAQGRLEKVNAFLPDLLSHPAWGCDAKSLWELSLTAYKSNLAWLEAMQQGSDQLKNIAQFLLNTAYNLQTRSLEQNIDHLYDLSGVEGEGSQFVSPLGEYFFSRTENLDNPRQLIKNIHALSALRERLRSYRPGVVLTLKDFVEFVDKIQAAQLRLTLASEAEADVNTISIMTAHKAKGREFESVFIVNATDHIWGSKSRGRSSRLQYPANLPIAPPGTSESERLRLFFVAMTRAKRELTISYALRNEAGKAQLRADFLTGEAWQATAGRDPVPPEKQLDIAQTDWHDRIVQPSTNLKSALTPLLKTYQLSATHLNGFLNVPRGGPRTFLIHNLLRFPRSISPQEALGSAIHATLKHAHDHIASAKEHRPLEDILYDFETNLRSMRLAKADFDYQLQKGSDALQSYLSKTYASFLPAQIGERNFHHQGIVIDGVKVTGIIDVLNVDAANKTVTISDYKTGKPSHSWIGKTDYEKIKLHQYKQQLLFYKLLIEASSDFRGYSVNKGVLEFIEPDEHGELITLELDYASEDLEHFKKLMSGVWKQIIASDFLNTSTYPQNYKGILAFEKDLLED